MKRLMAFTLLTILLASCSEVDERPLPPQMECAQREMYEHHDGIFALYLLSELEDSIDEMPDYIQTRYRLMKSEAEKTKLIRPAYQYQSDDLYHALRQRDSLFTQQISEEREAFELQRQKYQESLCQIHLLQWLGAVAILGVVVALYLLWLRRGRKKNGGADKIGTPILQPAFSDIILRLGRLADKGEQPTADEWEALRLHVLSLHPDWLHRHGLDRSDITPQDLQLCLLSTTTLRGKQAATLLGVSQQNLRNLRVRLYARICDQPCNSVEQFMAWVRA